MTLQWLLGWWNVVYLMPFLLAVVYLGLYTLTGITFGDADADGSTGSDMDADADTDGDIGGNVSAHYADLPAGSNLDVDADADGDISADADADSETHHAAHGHEAAGGHDRDSQGSVALQALTWLGVGKVPLSFVVMFFMMSWGVTGFATVQALRGRVDSGEAAGLMALPVALVVSLLFTRGATRVVDRWLPLSSTDARRRHELLNSVGDAMFDINESFGMASVCDNQGDRHQVACRVQPGHEPVTKGSTVRLVGYHGQGAFFYVVPEKAERTAAPVPPPSGRG
jgi:hypothetical protein